MGSVFNHAAHATCQQKNALFAEDTFRLYSADPQSYRYYRSLVPLLNDPTITYLHAGLRPPHEQYRRHSYRLDARSSRLAPSPKTLWSQTVSIARAELVRYLNVPTESLAFTSDTTEGMNLIQRSIKFERGDNVVVLEIEHPHHVYSS